MYKGLLKPQKTDIHSWDEYRKYWSQAEALKVLTSYPLHLDIELTSQCNLCCKMCWQNGLLIEEKQGLMQDIIFKHIE